MKSKASLNGVEMRAWKDGADEGRTVSAKAFTSLSSTNGFDHGLVWTPTSSNTLSDLATGTCFRTWFTGDTTNPEHQKLPWNRLELSAEALGGTVEAALAAEADHVYH